MHIIWCWNVRNKWWNLSECKMQKMSVYLPFVEEKPFMTNCPSTITRGSYRASRTIETMSDYQCSSLDATNTHTNRQLWSNQTSWIWCLVFDMIPIDTKLFQRTRTSQKYVHTNIWKTLSLIQLVWRASQMLFLKYVKWFLEW